MTEPKKTDSTTAASNESAACACGPWWRLPLLLGIVLAAIVLVRTSRIREAETVHEASPAGKANEAAVDPAGRAVSLTIRFDDGRERKFDALPWHEKMTIDDLLTAVSRLPDGISYAVQGYQDRALLTRIDEATNEGTEGRNWTYSVNDKSGDRSFAIWQLQAGDHVLWKFGRRE